MKKILMINEAFHGVVFTYTSQLCNEMVDNFEVYLVYSIRPQTPENYKEFIDKRVHLMGMKNFSVKVLANISNDSTVIKELMAIEEKFKLDIICLHSSDTGDIGRLEFKGRDNAMFYTPHGYAHILMDGGLQCKMYGVIEVILGKISNAITLTCCESEGKVAKELTKRTDYIETGVNLVDLSGEAIAMSLIENMFINKLILVSNVMSNESVIQDGLNEYVCEKAKDYASGIKAAIKMFSIELLERTYQDVLEIYNTEAMEKKYVDFYISIYLTGDSIILIICCFCFFFCPYYKEISNAIAPKLEVAA